MPRVARHDIEVGDLIYREYGWRPVVAVYHHENFTAVTYKWEGSYRDTHEWTPVHKTALVRKPE